jgi:outer membrane protein assembly factor BamB
LNADTGLPLWQYSLPGRLVHLEGTPTVANGKVFMGGGNAGVLCVELSIVTLEGKELPLSQVQELIDKRWKALREKYEEEKKKDPDFAIPPSEDLLPKPSPKVIWRRGQEQWHVDASLAVVQDRVLVASSYLDEEKLGIQSLYCLAADTGNLLWQVPLRLNPWAGPTVSGEMVVVGCSSIRFDPKTIPGAHGELIAVDLTNGAVKWQKAVPGGVVSPVAVKDGLAVFTGTDGKVRAWDLQSGEERWATSQGAAYFAGPAVVQRVIHTADLSGKAHALSLDDGRSLWTLNLASEAGINAPGMVYGSPVVHGGRLYLATCNLEGANARNPTVVICIGEK